MKLIATIRKLEVKLADLDKERAIADALVNDEGPDHELVFFLQNEFGLPHSKAQQLVLSYRNEFDSVAMPHGKDVLPLVRKYALTMGDKIPTNSLPDKLKSYAKKMHNKRTVYLNVKDSVNVGGSMHSPEHDNFDYSYVVEVDLNSGHVTDARQGLKMMDSKSLPVKPDHAVVEGDSHSGYMSVTVNPETAKKYNLKG